MVTIRDLQPQDAPALVELLEALGYAGTAPFIARRVAELIAHPDASTLVAVDARRTVIGFLSAHFIPQIALDGDFCRISYFCVSPAARSNGLGARLEQRIVELARARGCDRIELHSHQRRVDAHRFYARLGYVESPKYLMKRLIEAEPDA